MTDKSIEQQARDLLERMGIEGAQSFSSGDLVELANLIDESNTFRRSLRQALQADIDANEKLIQAKRELLDTTPQND